MQAPISSRRSFLLALTPEELVRDWTLLPADKALVLECRGDDHRRRFAVQLSALRNGGEFVEDYSSVSQQIMAHLDTQLGLQPTLFPLDAAARSATERGQRNRIRKHLGYVVFDECVEPRLREWLEENASDRLSIAALHERVQEVLHAWKILVTAPAALADFVRSVAAEAHEAVFEGIAQRLGPALRERIDDLLAVGDGQRTSGLFDFKSYPPTARIKTIKQHIRRYKRLAELGVGEIDLTGIGPELIADLARLTKAHSVWHLRRFRPTKRYALVASFLVEAQKTILDQLVQMHRNIIGEKVRDCQKLIDKRHRELRRQHKLAVGTLISVGRLIRDAHEAPPSSIEAFLNQVDIEGLNEALLNCEEYRTLEGRGFVNLLQNRYPTLRKYLPAFFELPFEAEHGSEAIHQALDLVRALDHGTLKSLPADAPTSFVPPALELTLRTEDDSIDRATWELGLAMAMRDALQAGDIYLPESRRFVSFSNLVKDDEQWAQERTEAYMELGHPSEPERALDLLREEFDRIANETSSGISDNPFASIRGRKLRLSSDDKLEVPDRVENLRRVIAAHLPRIRIEKLLAQVDFWCGFIRRLEPPPGFVPRSSDYYETLLAALVAHGTNLGLATMANSADGITVDRLQRVSKWLVREESLKSANAEIVDFHHRLSLSAVWGEGSLASADGQRFAVAGSGLITSFYPRHFGYYNRAVNILTHTSEQYSVFSTQVISCKPREAIFVLDGLLENQTILKIRDFATDTAGFTESIFGLCHLLGFTFMPRLRDLKDQQLYKLERDADYGCLNPLFRGTVDTALIAEQWDELVRLAASLRDRTCPANWLVQRLTSSSRSNRLAKALTMLGRVVKTIFILRYVHEPELRRMIRIQLNRGELRHDLTKWLFFARQGILPTGDRQELAHKASCLSLLSNAVVLWNTVHMEKLVEGLRASGEEVRNEDLARISPLVHQHVIQCGTYHFGRALESLDYESLPSFDA